MDSRRLLLLSTSTVFGAGYLDYAEKEVREFLPGIGRVLFVPFALQDHAAYAEKVRARFAGFGMEVESMHEAANPRQAAREAQAIFIGGGNTFRLLHALYELDLLGPIRDRVVGRDALSGFQRGLERRRAHHSHHQ